MATDAAVTGPETRKGSLALDAVERILALLSAALLVVVGVALVRGRAQWPAVPLPVWAHIATVGLALLLTPVMLLRRRGDRTHRRIGWVWMTAISLAAFASFFICDLNGGNFSFIHLLSIFTLVQVPRIVIAVRNNDIDRHRWGIRWLVIGGLLIAGYFTLLGARMLGNWLLG